jgi:hypothetical protein
MAKVQQINEINSDSAIKSFEITGHDMCITVKLFTEETVHVEFENVIAFRSILWSMKDDIEGLVMTDESSLLSKTIEELKKDEETDVSYKSFQFRNLDDEVKFEIVAKRLQVSGQRYE